MNLSFDIEQPNLTPNGPFGMSTPVRAPSVHENHQMHGMPQLTPFPTDGNQHGMMGMSPTMYYSPNQQEHGLGGAYAQAFKRTRLDSEGAGHPHGPGHPTSGFGSLRPCGMMISNTSGQSADLSQLLLSLGERAEKAETQLAELAAKHAADYQLLVDKISELEKKVASPILNGAGSTGTTTVKKPRKQRDSPLENAVQTTMRALLGVTHTRVNGKMALELPAPLEPGMPARMSAEGHKLWNPYWLKETTNAEDAKNAKFIDTVVSTLVANAKAPGTVSIIPAGSLEPPYEAIFNAVKGHFTYLCGKYQETVDPAAKGKGKKKVEDSRHRGRKKTKLARRMGHVSEFEKAHVVSGISEFVAYDYMSSEDDGPGLVSKERWAQKAGRYGGRGKTMLEVPRLNWRNEKVSRLFYALDKIAWDAGETSTHGRFHGFQENTNIDKPKCRVPHSMLDEGWIVASGNQNIIVAPEPKGVKLEDIEIDDCELDQEDLAALKEWKEWDSQPSQFDDTGIEEA